MSNSTVSNRRCSEIIRHFRAVLSSRALGESLSACGSYRSTAVTEISSGAFLALVRVYCEWV